MEVQAVQGGVPAAEPELAITLREFTLSDADAEAFMSWASDPRVVRFQRRPPLHRRPRPAAPLVPRHLRRRPPRGLHLRQARRAGPRGRRPPFMASVGYRVAREHWGRGVATRAVTAAADAVFAAWPWLRRLEAVADVENPASQRVLEKAGFVREGVLRQYIMLKGRPRDMVMFSIVDTDRGEHKQPVVETHGP
ncbi:hypothetical protein EJB05_05298, partial [Eragrostis curvula]